MNRSCLQRDVNSKEKRSGNLGEGKNKHSGAQTFQGVNAIQGKDDEVHERGGRDTRRTLESLAGE